jgi:predicted enzyme related to lactoylglutathione lyase
MATSDVKTVTANPVTWFEVQTPDPAKAKAFYGAAFGWTFTDDESGYVLIGQGEQAAIGGGIAPIPADEATRALFLVQVPDVEGALERVRDAGGAVIMPMQSTPNGIQFAYVADPTGAVLGVWKPPAT